MGVEKFQHLRLWYSKKIEYVFVIVNLTMSSANLTILYMCFNTFPIELLP